MPAPDGLLVVDKPPGWSSHDVVARCRRLAGTRRVGHAGTLDPMATGVLVLGIGRATRLLGYLALSSKSYDATVRLGQTTRTDDADGELLDSADASRLSDADVMLAAARFTGELVQVPSAVSAIKVQGRRAYARVRAGEDVVLAPRAVQVTAFRVLTVRRTGSLVDVEVRVECSTGTYVRALARDLGAELGVGGHLTALRRLAVGGYTIDRAHTLTDLESRPMDDLPIIALDEAARRDFTSYVVADDQVLAVRNGRVLDVQLRTPAHAGGADSPGTRPGDGPDRTGGRAGAGRPAARPVRAGRPGGQGDRRLRPRLTREGRYGPSTGQIWPLDRADMAPPTGQIWSLVRAVDGPPTGRRWPLERPDMAPRAGRDGPSSGRNWPGHRSDSRQPMPPQPGSWQALTCRPGQSRSSFSMQVWHDVTDIPTDLGSTVVTIGNFDGVHLGHRHVIRRARELAAERGGQPVVAVTFDPHPLTVVAPDRAPQPLSSLPERPSVARSGGCGRGTGPTVHLRAGQPPGGGLRHRHPVRRPPRRSRRGRGELPVRPPRPRRRRAADVAVRRSGSRRGGAASRRDPRALLVVDVHPGPYRRRRRRRRRRGARTAAHDPRVRGQRRPTRP